MPSDKSLIVELSVRGLDEDSNAAKCDFEFTPLLEGAILMMEGGRVRAMAGERTVISIAPPMLRDSSVRSGKFYLRSRA